MFSSVTVIAALAGSSGGASTAGSLDTGAVSDGAVPQLYLHRAQGIATSRARALCAFGKCLLQPGQEQTLRLEIPVSSLTQWDERDREVLPPGRIEWFLRDSGEDLLRGDFFVEEI